jgi:hypothetical protein
LEVRDRRRRRPCRPSDEDCSERRADADVCHRWMPCWPSRARSIRRLSGWQGAEVARRLCSP